MTNERAVEILNLDLDILGQYGDETAEAYKMAIKALEQQPCEDCISREEMLKYQQYLHGKMSNEENHKLWNFIKGLPSVTPKYTDEEIDKAQAVEQAYVDKMVELAVEESRQQVKPSDCVNRAVVKLDMLKHGFSSPNMTVTEFADSLPSVTPQRPKGKWSRKTKVDAYDIEGVKTWGIKCQCDRCSFTTIVVEDFGYYKYCPNCSAEMSGGAE